MDNTFLTILFFLFLSILHHPISASNLHKFKQLNSDFLAQSTSSHHTHTPPSPTKYFEVTKPIQLPKTKPCSYHVLHHDFGYTYGSPPVIANYTSPSHCSSNKFSKIVLEWKATCVGRQFDRIFGVWLDGVELLRSCTAEPRTNGIVWIVEKDITRYQSLLLNHEKNQTFAVFLGNIVDKTYTGVYHVDVTIHFYPFVVNTHETKKINSLASGSGFHADLILPISRNLPLNDGLWFEIQNSTDVGLKEFAVPRNAYRAVLEVYVSFHESDEFWYTNLPNEYLAANNLTNNTPGNGPFREVVVTLDGKVAGSVWPFTVIYTGGVNPLLWRPITGIGSFDLPSYDIEITPFLGTILDGKSHVFGFSVTNALNVWYIDANLHLWLDAESSRTEGELVNHIDKPLVESLVSDFIGLNGTFLTSAKKSILTTGWVRSSFGNITTSFVQNFDYYNKMVMAKDGGKQTVNQVIFFNDSVRAKLPLSYLDLVDNTHRRFSLYLDTDELEQNNDTYLAVSNATLGFDVNKSHSKGSGFSNSFLNNVQDGQGTMVVKKNLVISGVGETQQDYGYKSDESCYFRKIGVSNYTILYDKVKNSCNKRSRSRFGLNYIRKLPIML
ncbi:peptide-N(4)-(N-acetyl-beta-glucosaminyl)asparagine amidase [Trifolium pratense]|uniref:Peptide-N(4)-(N-acetyl-beta-glucosaminyl)asparagine amidase n=1 Tax=Trifolium pratense TaxID=57577 RepID=A0A2K3NDG9_TRIPR|nr:peptide-N(4)-(N-acetyl-beta-glucosaminyl)asparagine amidase [Trifolium pratense]